MRSSVGVALVALGVVTGVVCSNLIAPDAAAKSSPVKALEEREVCYPGTEDLGPDEMRIVALGTGMPQVIQKRTKASGWYVELGKGHRSLFDLGTGSMESLAALQPDWSQVDTVFLSHLHSDHAGDFAPLYIGGWMNGRYTPLYIYGSVRRRRVGRAG